MRLEAFFEKFELFADAPNAVAKMRELIFELAATGRLIPETLERSVEADKKLMGDVVELVMGQAPPGTDCNSEGRGTPFVKVGEFGPMYPEQTVWTTRPLKFAKRGDVLVCVVGATVGKLNLAIDCAIGRSVAAVRPSPAALITKFLYYSLMPYTLRLRRNSRGSAQGVIGKAELNAVSLWAPTISVQERIVAKVDELMALCDRLEVQQQERDTRHAALARASLTRFAEAPTPANLDFLFHQSYPIAPADLRKAILSLAVQGKLVPQYPNDEPADVMLDRIVTTAKSRHRGNGGPTEFDAPFDIPECWVWVKLPSVLNKLTDGTHHSPANGPSGDFMYITAKNIKSDGVQLGGITFVSEAVHEEIFSRCNPSFGDILYIKDGATTGVATINQVEEPFSMLSSVALLKPSEAIFNRYLLWVMRSPFFYAETRGAMKGAAITRVTLSVMAMSLLPLPPLAEQRRIVAKVDQLMALVDQLEAQLATSRAAAEKLMEAMVAELTTVA